MVGMYIVCAGDEMMVDVRQGFNLQEGKYMYSSTNVRPLLTPTYLEIFMSMSTPPPQHR